MKTDNQGFTKLTISERIIGFAERHEVAMVCIVLMAIITLAWVAMK